PVIVVPTRRSRTSSRNGFPPRRRRTYSSPLAVRNTTPACSLFEPGAICARTTVPVIRRRFGSISPAEIFRYFDDAVALGMGDQDANLGPCPIVIASRFGDALVLRQYGHFRVHPARLHRLAVSPAGDDAQIVDLPRFYFEAPLPGDFRHEIV